MLFQASSMFMSRRFPTSGQRRERMMSKAARLQRFRRGSGPNPKTTETTTQTLSVSKCRQQTAIAKRYHVCPVIPFLPCCGRSSRLNTVAIQNVRFAEPYIVFQEVRKQKLWVGAESEESKGVECLEPANSHELIGQHIIDKTAAVC
jgi:hypothetical protein